MRQSYSRRQALSLLSGAAATTAAAKVTSTTTGTLKGPRSAEEARPNSISWEQYLRGSAVSRTVIDNFLHGPTWAGFDAELGYTLKSSLVPWGIDMTRTIETFHTDGARSQFLYASRKPRINCYGDSFTECNQVNDGETWQEYLAGHFGEPVGNYGIGGYGLYQAYRRMLREEQTEHGAKYVVLYIWGDDPVRSLMRARWAAMYPWIKGQAAAQTWGFHGNFWPHVELDLSMGEFVELESPIKTAEMLYKMCDPDWMLAQLRDDLAVLLTVAQSISDLDRYRDNIAPLAEILKFVFNWKDRASYPQQAAELVNIYGQRATIFILDKARAFAEAKGKKLLVALNYTSADFAEMTDTKRLPNKEARTDRLILDHLTRNEFNYFDMNDVHRHEYGEHRGTYHSYMSQYMVNGMGHYNPRGNHLFAYSIKDKLVEMLDPKPLPYQKREAETVDFTGYLPGTGER